MGLVPGGQNRARAKFRLRAGERGRLCPCFSARPCDEDRCAAAHRPLACLRPSLSLTSVARRELRVAGRFVFRAKTVKNSLKRGVWRGRFSDTVSLIKMPGSGSCEVCRHRRKGLGRHWMGPCGSARRSRCVLSGSTLVPYHVSTDLTSVARARARAQLR